VITSIHISLVILCIMASRGDASIIHHDLHGAQLLFNLGNAVGAGFFIANIPFEGLDAGQFGEGLGTLFIAGIIGSHGEAAACRHVEMEAPIPRVPPVTIATLDMEFPVMVFIDTSSLPEGMGGHNQKRRGLA
jgi:hypothetical protein